MKNLKKVTAITLAVISLVACQKESQRLSSTESEKAETGLTSVNQNESITARGADKHVYTLSNLTAGNKVLDYTRASDGTLTYNADYATGGNGTGGGLGNQGAVILTDDDDVLLAVNAGSNSISSFKVTGNGLQLMSTVNSGGMRPVSITQNDDIVYVLNAGGTGNISGFELGGNNKLTPIAGSTRPLSSTSSGAAEIAFVNEGKVVVVTEKATNKIITYTVNKNGMPGMMHSITSANATPFGFDAGKKGNIFVSEAVGGAPGASTLSSYNVNNDGTITLTDGPVGAGQSAACWVVITKNGEYAYTTNTASNNLSLYNVNKNTGSISVNAAIAATSGIGPIDAALDNDSKYLYVLNAGSHSIIVYDVAPNGSLSTIQTVTGIPVGATGLAAR